MTVIICKICKKQFEVKNYRKLTALYCSKSCHAKGTVAGANKHGIKVKCKWCAKEYETNKGHHKKTKYCSRLCQNRCQANDTKISGRFNGIKNPMYNGGIQLYRKIARENLPWKCYRCASVKFLCVHHKDENRYNNALENLEVLCKRCHQLEHHCEKNLPQNRRIT